MAKRNRKPPIKPEIRRDWLRRHEENGDSPPEIARRDGFDVRTVRTQIERAQQERESREARLLVLRTAVERHYDDLLGYVKSLDPQVRAEADGLPLQDSEFLKSALRQHLPRSLIWGYLAKSRQLHQEAASLRQAVKQLVEQMAGVQVKLGSLTGTNSSEVTAGITVALVFQADQWSLGYAGLLTKDNLLSEPSGEGRVSIHYGAFGIAIVDASGALEVIETLRGLLVDLESRLRRSPEYLALEKTVAEIGRVNRKLQEELTTIRLRRIVPGRCKYCPL